MILSGKEIKNKLGNEIIIDPFDEKRLNPNSYNLRLHSDLLIYKNNLLDMKYPGGTISCCIPETGFILMPGKLYLARTMEYTKTTGYIPMLSGRSSTGRLGLFVHITAGFGDIGFAGYWTLELACIQPIRIYPGIEVCQICYHDIRGDYEEYHSKYQNNKGIQASELYKDFENAQNKG